MSSPRFNLWDRIVIRWRTFWARRRLRHLPPHKKGARVEFSEVFRRMQEKGWQPDLDEPPIPMFWEAPLPEKTTWE